MEFKGWHVKISNVYQYMDTNIMNQITNFDKGMYENNTEKKTFY